MNNKKKYFFNQAILKKLKLEKNYRKIAQRLRNTDIKWLIEDYKNIAREIAKMWKRQLYYANLKRLNSGIYTRSYAKKIENIRIKKGQTAAKAVTEEDFAEISKSIEKTIMSDIHQDKQFLINKMKKLIRMRMRKKYGKNKYLKPNFSTIKNTFMNVSKIRKGGGKVLGGIYEKVGEFVNPSGRHFEIWRRISDNEEVVIGPSDTGGDWSDENILATLEAMFASKNIKKLTKNE